MDSEQRAWGAAKATPAYELSVLSDTIAMYVDRPFRVDVAALTNARDEDQDNRAGLLQKGGVTGEQLRSKPQFAKLLESHGVVCGTKKGKAGAQYAFAKTDAFMKDLRSHSSPIVRALAEARLGLSSSIIPTRAKSLIEVAERNHGMAPSPVRYAGTHTLRMSGWDGINVQNLPRPLRPGLAAPHGMSYVSADAAQIEVRMLAWMANEPKMLEVFQRGGDPYCEFGTILYGRQITRQDEPERKFAKVCKLGLCYGMGADRLHGAAVSAGLNITLDDAKRAVKVYREAYPNVMAFWKAMERLVKALFSHGPFVYTASNGVDILRKTSSERVVYLPSGFGVCYHQMRFVEKTFDNYGGYQAFLARDEGAPSWRSLHGGSVTENFMQALCAELLRWQWAKAKEDAAHIFPRSPFCLQVHDELGAMVPTHLAETFKNILTSAMTSTPDWAKGLPLGYEADIALAYS